MKFDQALSDITGISVYRSRHVAPDQAYMVSLRDLIHPENIPGHWATRPIDPTSSEVTLAMLEQYSTDVARNRRWVAAHPKRYAVEQLGIAESDIRSVHEAWTSDHVIVRLWNHRRIRISRRNLHTAGHYKTRTPFSLT